MTRPSYFLIAVSTKENLERCKKHALAGLTSSSNGAWGFCDIPIGSRVSFVYGASAHNLYEVKEKFCVDEPEALMPWGNLRLGPGRYYSFPFRLQLEPIREFTHPLTSEKFRYVAENLMLRGGYRKTHFQADSNDLGYASEVGELSTGRYEKLVQPHSDMHVSFTRKKVKQGWPVFRLKEIVIQAAIRDYLSHEQYLSRFLHDIGLSSVEPNSLEVLGEKALLEGYVDILLKEANPTGKSRKIIVEIKLKKASKRDYDQLSNYMNLFKEECLAGILVARDLGPLRKLTPREGMKYFTYECNDEDPIEFEELASSIKLTPRDIIR